MADERATVTYLGPTTPGDPSQAIEVEGRRFEKDQPVTNVPKTVLAAVEEVAANQPHTFTVEKEG